MLWKLFTPIDEFVDLFIQVRYLVRDLFLNFSRDFLTDLLLYRIGNVLLDFGRIISATQCIKSDLIVPVLFMAR